MPTQVRGVPGGTCVRLHSCRAPPPAEVLVDEGLRGCGRLNVRVAPCSKGPALALPLQKEDELLQPQVLILQVGPHIHLSRSCAPSCTPGGADRPPPCPGRPPLLLHSIQIMAHGTHIPDYPIHTIAPSLITRPLRTHTCTSWWMSRAMGRAVWQPHGAFRVNMRCFCRCAGRGAARSLRLSQSRCSKACVGRCGRGCVLSVVERGAGRSVAQQEVELVIALFQEQGDGGLQIALCQHGLVSNPVPCIIDVLLARASAASMALVV
mmetsp:Transcript_22433/g.61978  ORF Transcript_22433/g.61978 Transcript_22433/m.61978 type:complete len:265 (-) Transcript_22433:213-1007(-)